MFEVWDGNLDVDGKYLLVPFRLQEEFNFFLNECEIKGQPSEVLIIADVDSDSANLLLQFINIDRSFLQWTELPSESFLSLWMVFLRCIRACQYDRAIEIRQLLLKQSPSILERISVLSEFLIDWVRLSSPLFNRYSLVLQDGFISHIEDALIFSREMHLKGVVDWIAKFSQKTDGDVDHLVCFEHIRNFKSSLSYLYGTDNSKRLLAQCGLLLAIARRECEQANTQIVALCLHRCIEIYFTLQLYQSRWAQLRRDGRFRYREELISGEPRERHRESLINSFYFCRSRQLLGTAAGDSEIVERVNDLRNELTLTHGYSQPSKLEMLEMLGKVRNLIVRLEGESNIFSKILVGFDYWPSIPNDFIFDIQSSLRGYFKIATI